MVIGSSVLYAADGATATITLNRPDTLNPLDWTTVKALGDAVREVERDPAVRIVRITGAGRAFSAGGDLEGYLTLYRDSAGFRRFLQDFHDCLAAIEASEKIYVAVVNGVCVAGGLELILACDLVAIAEEARIGDGHLNFGQLPGAGGSQRLPRAIGVIRAKHLMLTGHLIDGREAERIGLACLAVPRERLDEAVDELCAGLAQKSPAGLRGAKYLVNEGLRGSLEQGLQLEMTHVHYYATSEPDAIEGLVAFKEKRAPRFSADG